MKFCVTAPCMHFSKQIVQLIVCLFLFNHNIDMRVVATLLLLNLVKRVAVAAERGLICFALRFLIARAPKVPYDKIAGLHSGSNNLGVAHIMCSILWGVQGTGCGLQL